MSEKASSRAQGLDRAVGLFDKALRVLLTIGFAVILIVTLAQVAGRHGVIPGITGADEIARYLMVATTFLAIPVLTASRLHIAVDALAHYLPDGATQLWLQRMILLVETVFYAMFANYALLVWDGYRGTGQSSAELSIPLAWPTLTIVVGAALGAVLTALLLVRTFLVPQQYLVKHDSGLPATASSPTSEGTDR